MYNKKRKFKIKYLIKPNEMQTILNCKFFVIYSLQNFVTKLILSKVTITFTHCNINVK